MQLTRRFGSSLAALTALAAAAALIGILAAVLLAIPPLHILTFLLYQIAGVALPGVTLLKLFRLELSPLENLVAAYGLGLLVNIAVYFILSPFYLGGLIPFAVAAVALLSAAAAFLLRRRRMCAAGDRGELAVGLAFALLSALVTFALLSATTLTPDISGTRGYYHDLTNGVALAASAYNGFPMEFMQMAFTEHYYHPFFYSYCAVLQRCLGFSAFEAATKFSLISLAPFFSAAFVAAARRVFYKNRNIVLSAAGLFLFFYVMVYYVHIDLLGFSPGIAFGVLTLLFFIRGQQTPSRGCNRYHLLSLLFLLGALGAKGPVGVTTVFALCFALLLDLLRGGKWLRTLSTGLLYAASFFGCYFLLYQQGAESMIPRGENLFGARWDILQTLPESWPGPLRNLAANLLFTADYHRLLSVCLLILLLYLIFFRKKPQITVDYAFGGLLCGVTLSNLFLQHGSSEVYFLYAIIPAALLASFYAVIQFLLAMPKKPRVIAGALLLLLLSPLLVSEAVKTVTTVAPDVETALTYSRFSDRLILTDGDIASMGSSARANSITPAEYEGLLWLRDNTDRNAVIAEGRHLIHNKFFYGTALAERRFFLEGWGYVTMEDSNDNTPEKVRREAILYNFYTFEDEQFIPLMRASGIQYVILYDYQNPGWKLQNLFDSKTAFENGHIRIYDIRGQG